jgi:hypothetical protein
VSQQIAKALAKALGVRQQEPSEEQLLWRLRVRPLLNIFRGLGCMNPRDKVYAALPLALPQDHPSFAPDYGLSISDVYTRIGEAFIAREGCLSILADNSGCSNERGLPSWVPDFRCLLRSHSLCARLDTHCQSIYRASGSRPPNVKIREKTFDPQVDDPSYVGRSHRSYLRVSTPNILEARGITLDKISALAPLCNTKQIRRPTWEAFLRTLPPYYIPTQEPVRHSYQRLLTGDVQKTIFFNGYGPHATRSQKVTTFIETVERDFWEWLAQTDNHPPSYSVLQAYLEVPGPRHKHEACIRPAPIVSDFYEREEPSEDPDTSGLSEEETATVLAKRDETRRVKELVEKTVMNRVLCVTEKGYMGLVPYEAKIGDQIVVLFGGNTPFLLRESDEDVHGERRWLLVGECYVHGFMDGEAINGLDEEEFEGRSETFVLT